LSLIWVCCFEVRPFAAACRSMAFDVGSDRQLGSGVPDDGGAALKSQYQLG
jgi:hypothetical protein